MRPQPGEFYRHFKNKYYQIVAIAKHSETKEELVIYQALYGDFGIYARPLDMFTSEVDHVKYPDVTQKMRFEKVDKIPSDNTSVNETVVEVQENSNSSYETPWADERVNEYLDAPTYSAKIEVLKKYRNKIDNKLIEAAAGSLDVVITGETLEEKYDDIMRHLLTLAKFDVTRLR